MMKIRTSKIAAIMLAVVLVILIASLLTGCYPPPQPVKIHYGFSVNSKNGLFTGQIYWGVNQTDMTEYISTPAGGYGSDFELGPYDKFFLRVESPGHTFVLYIVKDGDIVGTVQILPGQTYELCDGCNNGEGW